MRTRWIFSLLAVTAFVFFSQPAFADDLADLKATHQSFIKAWNTGDIDAIFEIWQDGGIWLPSNRGFPVVTNSAMGKQMFAKWFETHIFYVEWYKVEYRVIGDTGLVWGVTSTIAMVKNTGMGKRYNEKETVVFVKSNGKWEAVMSHSTPIQPDADIF